MNILKSKLSKTVIIAGIVYIYNKETKLMNLIIFKTI